ncbi:MAG: Tad domain-containing protein [Candidatus Limnocylindrales bacterium]
MRHARLARRTSAGGQILVVVAGGLIGLLAIAAFALEGGTLVLNRRDAQNASDLGSVAGAHIVALRYTDTTTTRTQADVFGAIRASMDQNDCAAAVPCTWNARFVGVGLTTLGAVTNASAAIPTGSLGVRVEVTRTPGALLGRVLGFNTWTVSTEATAITAKPTSIGTGILLPIVLCGWGTTGINDCQPADDSPANAIRFEPGQVYDLTDGKDAPGGFGWLSWTGSPSAGTLETSLCNPNNPPFTLDRPYDSPGDFHRGSDPIGTNPATGETWIPVGNGKMGSSDVRACLQKWIDSKLPVMVPVYDIDNGDTGNNLAYHITGVAAFVMTAREQPAADQIQGYFVEYIPFTSIPGGAGTVPPGPGDTTVFIGLVK